MTLLDGSNAQREAFSERVMAAIASMAMPSPTRSLLEAMRARSGRDALAAITVAWHLATQRDWPLEPRVRARSFALVLAVATVLGTGSMVAASAARVIVPHAHRTEILEQRGSIILEPAPAQIAPTSPGRPTQVSVTIPVPMAVPVVVPKKAPVSTVKHPAPRPARTTQCTAARHRCMTQTSTRVATDRPPIPRTAATMTILGRHLMTLPLATTPITATTPIMATTPTMDMTAGRPRTRDPCRGGPRRGRGCRATLTRR